MSNFRSPNSNASSFSVDVNDLIKAGLAVPVGEVWTFASMTTILGRKPNGGDGSVQRALKYLCLQHGVEFENVRSDGYRRLSDQGIVGVLPRDRMRVRSVVKRSKIRMSNVQDYAALPNHAKLQHDTHAAVLGVMSALNSPKIIKAIEVDHARSKATVDEHAVMALLVKPKTERNF